MLLAIKINDHWRITQKIKGKYWAVIWKKKKSITNESVQITNIEILTQLSKEDSESYDDKFNTLNGFLDNSHREMNAKLRDRKHIIYPIKSWIWTQMIITIMMILIVFG